MYFGLCHIHLAPKQANSLTFPVSCCFILCEVWKINSHLHLVYRQTKQRPRLVYNQITWIILIHSAQRREKQQLNGQVREIRRRFITRNNTQTIIFKADWRTHQCQIAYSARFRRRWRFVLWNSEFKYDTLQSGVRVPKILKNVLTTKWTNRVTMGAAFPAETNHRPCHRLHKTKRYSVCTYRL